MQVRAFASKCSHTVRQLTGHHAHVGDHEPRPQRYDGAIADRERADAPGLGEARDALEPDFHDVARELSRNGYASRDDGAARVDLDALDRALTKNRRRHLEAP